MNVQCCVNKAVGRPTFFLSAVSRAAVSWSYRGEVNTTTNHWILTNYICMNKNNVLSEAAIHKHTCMHTFVSTYMYV